MSRWVRAQVTVTANFVQRPRPPSKSSVTFNDSNLQVTASHSALVSLVSPWNPRNVLNISSFCKRNAATLMQGIWSRTTWNLCNSRNGLKFGSQPLRTLRGQAGNLSRPYNGLPERSCRSVSTSVAQGMRLHDSSPIITFQIPNDGDVDLTHLSRAYISRASAQAVRIACREGCIRDAFAIVKSLHHSYHPSSTAFNNKSTPPSPRNTLHLAINFKRQISPRLASHALVHGLIRLGHTEKAGELAHSLLQMDMRIRTKTLEHAIGLLCTADNAMVSHDSNAAPQSSSRPHFFGSIPRCFSPELVERPSTRLALQIFFAAKQHRQQRTKQMLQSLIDACLLQGEILVVSILFAFLVKQWQIRQAIDAGKKNADVLSEVDSFPLDKSNLQELKSGFSSHHCYPYPDPSFMIKMLSYIDARLCNEPLEYDTSNTADRGNCIQALAILASLLDERAIPFRNTALLIRSLYLNPAASGTVWVRRKRRWREENVQDYLRRVLDGLIDEVIASNKDPPRTTRRTWERLRSTLDRHSCNALLHYSLRHRMSPARAEAIIHHMSRRRDTQCRPNITTFNTLMRDATLMRRNDIVLKTLQFLKANSTGSDASESNALYDKILHHIHNTPERSVVPSFSNTQLRSLSEPFELRVSNACIRRRKLAMNAVTVNVCISFMTATGSPEAAADILFLFFPELRTGRNQMESRQQVVLRAMRLGPRFITTMLNALCKARRTDLAEKLWFIAREAELCSCKPALMPPMGPWSLPMEAYTVMLQCYAYESKKGVSAGSRISKKPLGWGRPFRRVRRNLGRSAFSRPATARRMGWLLMKSFFDSRERTQDIVARFGDAKHAERVLVKAPDARFFSAALRLFGHFKRLNRRSPSYWRRLVRRAENLYISLGHLGPKPDPEMMLILAAIRREGLPIPVLFSRSVPPSSLNGARSGNRSLSVSFPSSRRFDPPHLLPTSKIRGLHVRKGWKGRRLDCSSRWRPCMQP